ncbi:MAG: hypothetical protein PF904_19640 [Kiritimatiellae bacterium]|jgi:hypothetical protein|nr:hypothetical protein [Kiritimatiellia bacterium]
MVNNIKNVTVFDMHDYLLKRNPAFLFENLFILFLSIFERHPPHILAVPPITCWGWLALASLLITLQSANRAMHLNKMTTTSQPANGEAGYGESFACESALGLIDFRHRHMTANDRRDTGQ